MSSPPSLRTPVEALAAALAMPLWPDARDRVVRWLEEARAWNAKLDLTAARTDAALVEVLLADALVAQDRDLVPEGARLLDAGTGAGTPGLAIALLRPDVEATLAEPLGKRAAFLRSVVGALGVATRVKVIGERIDPSAPRAPGTSGRTEPDLFASRATFAPEVAAEVGLRLAPAALLFLVEETPPLPAGARIVAERRYRLPSSGASRRIVRIERSHRS